MRMVFALVAFAVFPVFAGMNRGPFAALLRRRDVPCARGDDTGCRNPGLNASVCSPRSVGMNRCSLAPASFQGGGSGAFVTVGNVALHGVWRHQRLVYSVDARTWSPGPSGRDAWGRRPDAARADETEPDASWKRERKGALRRDTMGIATAGELMWPVLRALEGLGGSASIGELDDRVATDMDICEADLDIVHGDGTQSEFAYRCAWARTHLRRIGAVENSARGVWAITEAGRRIGSAEEAQELVRRERKDFRSGLRDAAAQPADVAEHAGEPTTGD